MVILWLLLLVINLHFMFLYFLLYYFAVDKSMYECLKLSMNSIIVKEEY